MEILKAIFLGILSIALAIGGVFVTIGVFIVGIATALVVNIVALAGIIFMGLMSLFSGNRK